MLGRDFEDEVRSRSVFELASNPIGYFGKMNSTLGSVVPLAMFVIYRCIIFLFSNFMARGVQCSEIIRKEYAKSL